jgi:hypothetical protein
MAREAVLALAQALRAMGVDPQVISTLENAEVQNGQVTYPEAALTGFVSAIQQATTALTASAVPVQQAGARTTCGQCGRVCNTAAALYQHSRDVHTGTVCYWQNCGTTTPTEEELKAHLRSHQRAAVDQGGDKLRCHWPGCDRIFTRADSVVRCLLSHNAALRAQNTGH